MALKGESFLEKKPQNDDKRQNKAFLQGLSFFSQVGVTMAACVLVGVFLGKYLDGLWGTSPWLLLVFSFLGVGAAFKALFDLGGRK
jgi:ATP synthase protein I